MLLRNAFYFRKMSNNIMVLNFMSNITSDFGILFLLHCNKKIRKYLQFHRQLSFIKCSIRLPDTNVNGIQ